ncbi:MAG: Pr6Pr family membrane protein [Candidatus Nanopelagicales bacterium]
MTVTQAGTSTVAPAGSWVGVARVYWAIVASIGTLSFLVSCGIAMTQEGNGGALNGLIFTLSYFTVWSNILTFCMNWSLVADPQRDGHVFRWLRMSSLVMITITGLVYAIVLAPDAHPVGLGVYTNIGYHYISPWATVLGFLLFGPRPRFLVRTVFSMLAIPSVWLVYTLLRGLLLTTPPPDAPATQLGEPQHWYPYPFIDVNDPSPLIPGLEFGGYAGVAANIVVIVIMGLVFGFMFLLLDRLLSKGHRAHPLP